MKKVLTTVSAAAAAMAMTAVTVFADVVVEPFTFGDNSGTLPEWALPTLAVIGAAAVVGIVTAVIRKFRK